MSSFQQRRDQLKADLVIQGDRVYEILLRSAECYFDRDRVKAASVISADGMIDKVDVDIERASIALLQGGVTDSYDIRFVLTIVKVNNELERIADCAVNIADVVVEQVEEIKEQPPATFRVMFNSVIGMVRDANRSLSELNVDLATQVLAFDDTVGEFKRQIGLDAETNVASGEYSIGFGFRLRRVTSQLERIADHCTNICEQVIYLESGKIVRHLPEGWTVPELPDPER